MYLLCWPRDIERSTRHGSYYPQETGKSGGEADVYKHIHDITYKYKIYNKGFFPPSNYSCNITETYILLGELRNPSWKQKQNPVGE